MIVAVLWKGGKMYKLLEQIEGTHILYGLGVGLVAGLVWYALDIYVVSRVETMIGVTPGQL